MAVARMFPRASLCHELRFQLDADLLVDELHRRNPAEIHLARLVQARPDHLLIEVLDARGVHRTDAARERIA